MNLKLRDADLRKEKVVGITELTIQSGISLKISKISARRAISGDIVTGYFRESRFTSQALLDEDAIIATMAGVELNA